MKTAGIICEYNPFHLGHLRQFRLVREQLRQDAPIVCLMSGNYVQRGMPARWDKSTRAAAALNCGADLVLELPLTAVLQSAEGFARNGVEILSRLGCVDVLSFGAECGSAEALTVLADRLDSEEFSQGLRQALDAGLPYAAARQQALGDTQGLLSKPNNILGLEYCRANSTLPHPMELLPILRDGDYHACLPQADAPSATGIRNLHPDGNWRDYVPKETAELLENAPWYDFSFGERAFLARLRSLTDGQWEQCAHGSEGLWRKVMKAVRTQPDVEQILQASKSKRYPRTRLQRLLMCAYLGISDDLLRQPIPYVRVLAVSQTGRTLLRKAKTVDALTLINAGETPPDQDYFRLECRAADLFTLFSAPDFPCPCQTEQNARVYLP